MLRVEAVYRLSAKEALKHPFFKKQRNGTQEGAEMPRMRGETLKTIVHREAVRLSFEQFPSKQQSIDTHGKPEVKCSITYNLNLTKAPQLGILRQKLHRKLRRNHV